MYECGPKGTPTKYLLLVNLGGWENLQCFGHLIEQENPSLQDVHTGGENDQNTSYRINIDVEMYAYLELSTIFLTFL